MKTYTHKCIKPGCETRYEDTDPEPYYCKPHTDEKKQLAEQIDAQVQARGPRRQTVSALQEYEAAEKVRGFVRTSL